MLKISWVKYTLLLLALFLVFYGVYITVNLELSRGTVIIVAGFGLIILTQFDWGGD